MRYIIIPIINAYNKIVGFINLVIDTCMHIVRAIHIRHVMQ
ncbi:MAG: hypothetical protein ACM3Q2_00275 [Syntrophothermus sp.]